MNCLKNYDLKVSITDFGAVSGSDELQTASIQAAIDYCFKNGGGEIQIPKGEFLSGAIRLRSNTTLHLLEDAKLVGSRNADDYYVLPGDTLEPVPAYIIEEEERINGRSPDGIHYGRRWQNSFIKIFRAENVAVIGDKNSVIDGQDCYDALGEEGFRGPHCIAIGQSKNIVFCGYTIKNSANWAHCIWETNDIYCENISIIAGHDGFDVFCCENVHVKDCDFFTGDDSVAGYGNYNVLFENCNMSSSCSAFRFAGTDVIVRNCKIEGNSPYLHRYTLNKEEQITNVILPDEQNPNHRYRMKSFYTYYADNRIEIKRAPTLVFENCVIANPTKFFHYNFSGSEEWSTICPLKNITFKNMTVSNVNLPMVAYGDKNKIIEVSLENVTINVADDFEDDCLIKTANLKKLSFKNVVINNFKGSSLIKNYGKNTGEIVFDNASYGDNVKDIVETDEQFYVDFI